MNIFTALIFSASVLAAGVSSACGNKECVEIKHQKLLIKDPRFKSLKGAKAASAYLTLENTGTEDDVLVDVKISDLLANSTEFHQHIQKNGIMQMRAIDKIDLKAGKTIELKPKHDHIMLMGINERLHALDDVSMTLVFQKAGEVNVTFRRITQQDCNCNN